MPITRTAIIDDDGSGKTGTVIDNAWKQELYNQIDGVAGAAAVAWTPVDLSGAGLVFTSTSAYAVKSGATVFYWCQLQFPATANGTQAKIGTLPFSCGYVNAGGYTTYGLANTVHFPAGVNFFYLINPNGTARSNAEMSGALWIGAGHFLAV